MVDERESPSAGWREVCDEMATDPGVEEPVAACPDCGRACDHVLRDVYECEEHGVFRASANAKETDDGDASGADERDEAERRASGPAD